MVLLRRMSAIAFVFCLMCWIDHAQGAWIPNGMPVCIAPGDQIQPQIISDGRYGAIIVWKDNRSSTNGAQYNFYAQRIDSSGNALWGTDGIQVCAKNVSKDDEELGIFRKLAIVSDGTGGAIIAWDDLRDKERLVFAQKIDSLGRPTWGNDYVMASGSLLGSPIIADGSGGAIIVWNENATGISNVRRIDSTHETKWSASLTPTLDTYKAQIYSDGLGGTLLIWIEGDILSGRVLVQKLDSDGKALWGSHGRRITKELQDPEVCFLSYAPPYYIIAYKAEYKPYDPCYIGIVWLDSEGNISEKAHGDGWLDPQPRTTVAIASDGATGILYAFHYLPDSVNPFATKSYKIFANRISTTGDSLWKGKKQVCKSLGNQLFPYCITDCSKGAIVAWEDMRAESENAADIFSQRIDCDGNLMWGAGGVPVCLERGNQSHVVMIPDGFGGAIISWQDSRNGHSDIYSQRIAASGNVSLE